MIGGKAHTYLTVDICHPIDSNIDIIEIADIDATDIWIASPDIMRVNPAFLAKIMFGNSHFSSIKG